jgi:hypothetical protein
MIVGVSVTKSTLWRGINEEFSNVYHYDAAADTTSQQIADSVVAAERALHGSNVTFKGVKVWGPTDGPKEQSVMLLQQTLTGNGSQLSGVPTAKELAIVVQWDTGRKNSRGGRIFLRKYIHLGMMSGGTEDMAKGNTAMVAAVTDPVVTYANKVKNAVGISGANITDKKGRGLPLGTAAQVLPHMHTRQFRR